MVKLPETHRRTYYTTARIIHDSTELFDDWLWINASASHEFNTPEGAQTIVNLSNENARESGLAVDEYPYFVVKVTRTSEVERVEL